MGVQIICNPFLTKFWPQNPTNMTLLPGRFACDLPREHSWRRMQLTSPPVLCVGMNLWCVAVSFFRHVSGHIPFRLTYHSGSLTDTYVRTQVYKWQGRRQPTLALHRPRALGRDARPLRRHARRAAQEAEVALDVSARPC
jgi:hypothetical protein